MSIRPGTVWYWLGLGVAVVLVLVAILWNAWAFSQYQTAQRQLEVLGVDPDSTTEVLAAGSPEAAELELLLDADRRGILGAGFAALLTAPQKHAIARARRDRLAERSADRQTSLLAGAGLILGALAVFLIGRRARRRA